MRREIRVQLPVNCFIYLISHFVRLMQDDVCCGTDGIKPPKYAAVNWILPSRDYVTVQLFRRSRLRSVFPVIQDPVGHALWWKAHNQWFSCQAGWRCSWPHDLIALHLAWGWCYAAATARLPRQRWETGDALQWAEGKAQTSPPFLCCIGSAFCQTRYRIKTKRRVQNALQPAVFHGVLCNANAEARELLCPASSVRLVKRVCGFFGLTFGNFWAKEGG